MAATATVTKATAKKLREQRADLILKAQRLVEEKQDEQGLLAAEDQAAVDKMLEDADALNQQAKSRERLETAADGLSAPSGSRIPLDPSAGPAERASDKPRAVKVRSGFDGAGKPNYVEIPTDARGSDEYRENFSRALSGAQLSGEQFAALQSDNAEQAGYLVASEQFASELLKTVDDNVIIRQFANVHTVREAKSLGIRARTAKASTFAWSAEIQAPTGDTALKYGKRNLEPHYLAGEITLSRDLLRMSVVPVDREVRYELARDAGEVQETAFMTGSGAQRPLGLFIATSDGISTARDSLTGSATSITANGLISAKYKLKEQYRRGGVRQGAQWLFHRDAIAIIAKLTDSSVGFLMRPGRGLQDDDPDTLLGMPLRESEFVPNTFTTGLYVGMLGQFRYYEIADALDIEILVLTEISARTNQVVYLARLKTDGMPTLEEAFVRLKTD
ncbi:MAG: phage major capsid protein [Planctomycetaceae bacterium]|nr:phage major capsid protein [Planctomycetaceae bacterium]